MGIEAGVANQVTVKFHN